MSDYETAWSRYRQCMLDRGYKEIVLYTMLNGIRRESPHKSGTEAQENKYRDDADDRAAACSRNAGQGSGRKATRWTSCCCPLAVRPSCRVAGRRSYAARVAGWSARLLAVDGIGDPTDAAVPLLQEPVAPNPVSLRQSHLVFQGHHARRGGCHLLREGRVGLRAGDDTVKNRRHI